MKQGRPPAAPAPFPECVPALVGHIPSMAASLVVQAAQSGVKVLLRALAGALDLALDTRPPASHRLASEPSVTSHLMVGVRVCSKCHVGADEDSCWMCGGPLT